MLTKELHNERFAVDLPVYHLLSRHNISFGLTDGGIVTGLSFLCQLLFTGVLLRPPFISLPLPFRLSLIHILPQNAQVVNQFCGL